MSAAETSPKALARREALAALLSSATPGEACDRFPSLLSPEGVEAIYAEVLRLMREDLDEAWRLAEAAVSVAQLLKRPASLGAALRARANVLYLRGHYDAAIADYREAVNQFEAGCANGADGMELEIARTRNGAIQTLAYLGRYEEALRWGEEAREVFARHQDSVRIARLDGNLGNLYFRLDRFEEALRSYEWAREEFSRSGSPQDIAAVLSNLAACYISVGRFDDSLQAHREARNHSERHGFPLLVAQADYNIAYAHFLRGDHREAMRLYAGARTHAAQAGDHYHATLCDLDQAEMMLELNLSEEAARLARQAMRGFRRLGMRYERAKASVFLGMALAGARDSRGAARTFRAARVLFVNEGNRVWPALIDLHLALIDLDRGAVSRARARAQDAVLAFSQRQLPSQSVLAELILARILSAEGDFCQAESLCVTAAKRAEAIGSPGLRFRAEYLLGEQHRVQGQPQKALYAWQGAAEAVALLREGIPEEELRIRFLEAKAPLYERLVDLHLGEPALARDNQAAFGCVQSAKSRAFLDIFARQACGSEPASTSESPPLAAIRVKLRQSYVRASEAELRDDKAEIRIWRNQTALLEQELRDEMARLRLIGEHAPLESDSGEFGRIAEASAISAALRPGSNLVEYFCTPERVYAFLLRPGRPLEVFALGQTPALRGVVRLAQFQISNYQVRRCSGAAPEGASSALRAHLLRLHRELVEPLLPSIEGDQLIFAPHGFLHGLPFSALGTEDEPLLRRFRISRTLSSSAFLACGKRPPPRATHSALVLGLPDSRAPRIAEEAERVARYFSDASLRLGPDASLSALREIGGKVRFLHICSHGLFRSDNPTFSAIRLGDGNLNLHELQDMHFAADLVTLSGCSTGVNAVVAGDELIGLSRGFLRAGARNLLVSLWDVSDESTTELMDHFYAAIASGVRPAEALRRASLLLSDRYRHPYHWAAFGLMAGEIV